MAVGCPAPRPPRRRPGTPRAAALAGGTMLPPSGAARQTDCPPRCWVVVLRRLATEPYGDEHQLRIVYKYRRSCSHQISLFWPGTTVQCFTGTDQTGLEGELARVAATPYTPVHGLG